MENTLRCFANARSTTSSALVLRACALCLGLTSIVAVARNATAAEFGRRVAVLRFDFEGKVPEVGRVFLSQRLVEGLAAAGFQVSAGEILKGALKKRPALEGCRAEACYRAIAEVLGVDHLVTGTIDVKEKNYEIRLEIIDGGLGKALGEGRERCEICGIQEVGEKLDRVASALNRFIKHESPGEAPTLARVAVQSRPAGAEVKLDGRAAGVTPLALELPPGVYQLAVAASGYHSAQRIVRTASGVNETISLDLLPDAHPLSLTIGPWRQLGITSLVVGGLALAAGITARYFDGRAVRCPPGTPPQQRCHRQTDILTAALLAGGGTAAAAGGIVLYLSALPSPGGGDLSSEHSSDPRAWLLSIQRTF